jgi:hypothetical protein
MDNRRLWSELMRQRFSQVALVVLIVLLGALVGQPYLRGHISKADGTKKRLGGS